MRARGCLQALQAFSNSEMLVTYGTAGGILMWDCSSMEFNDSGSRDSFETEHPPLWTATSSNGRLLATCAGNSHAVVRDPVTLAIIHEMPARQGSRVRSAAFSGDCKLLALVLQDSSITLWDLSRQDIVWQPQGRGMMAAVDAHHVGVNACFLSEVRVKRERARLRAVCCACLRMRLCWFASTLMRMLPAARGHPGHDLQGLHGARVERAAAAAGAHLCWAHGASGVRMAEPRRADADHRQRRLHGARVGHREWAREYRACA
jgi:hypothetical protein